MRDYLTGLKLTTALDVATGRGEFIEMIRYLAGDGIKITGVDNSERMLKLAADNDLKVEFVKGDAYTLGFSDESFDLITISFATRNLNVTKSSLIQSFKEFYRVLKPGGHFINLETSQPPFYLFRKGFHLYVTLFVKLLGSGISGSKTAYAYLAKSMTLFYSADELTDIIKQTGFEKVNFRRLMFGAAAIHHSRKI